MSVGCGSASFAARVLAPLLSFSSWTLMGDATPMACIPGLVSSSIDSAVSETNLNVSGLRLISSVACSVLAGAQTKVSGLCEKTRQLRQRVGLWGEDN